ncbi:ricin-type beta-trefoil lectin domain protein [Lentzea tibetensis]|uniref:Ricin-type beta-trefoil lectin domain protein n=1 Tax=Lentzea tibetensis TaxID=2591470 RepID=A0A563F170_9PSEU|nr:RICIN domain-containing protein [Lentzea tibetensis]TWP53501.1 ricin-type beta-trefoil lectin domain protein [Lentzea tibetensis]
MGRNTWRAAIGLLAAAALLVVPGVASAADEAGKADASQRPVLSAEDIATNGINVNAVYYLRNRHSNKCLEIYGWSQANGGLAVQWDCHYGNNQLWRFIQHADGYYSLQNVNSNKCLDVYGWSTANGAQIVQWDCHWGDNQRWWEAFPGNSTLRYISKFSGKSLETYGWSLNNGGAVVQWDWHGGNNQRWY